MALQLTGDLSRVSPNSRPITAGRSSSRVQEEVGIKDKWMFVVWLFLESISLFEMMGVQFLICLFVVFYSWWKSISTGCQKSKCLFEYEIDT